MNFNADFGKIEARVASMVGHGFRVCRFKDFHNLGVWYYICSYVGVRAVYLWEDGSINGNTGCNVVVCGLNGEELKTAQLKGYADAPGYWATEAEADEFLLAWKAGNDIPEDGCDE